MKTVLVKIVRDVDKYSLGDVVWVDPETAAQMVRDGVAAMCDDRGLVKANVVRKAAEGDLWPS